MKLKKFEIYICESCYELKGQTCRTPGCVFCWKDIDEVGRMLEDLLIRPVVDGERLRL